MKPTPMAASDFRLLPTGQQYAMYAEAFRDRAELIEALRSLVKAEEDYGDPHNAAVNEAWGPASALLSRLGAA